MINDNSSLFSVMVFTKLDAMGLSQKEFAKAIGLKASSVSEIKSGITLPSKGKLPKIAEILEFDYKSLEQAYEMSEEDRVIMKAKKDYNDKETSTLRNVKNKILRSYATPKDLLAIEKHAYVIAIITHNFWSDIQGHEAVKKQRKIIECNNDNNKGVVYRYLYSDTPYQSEIELRMRKETDAHSEFSLAQKVKNIYSEKKNTKFEFYKIKHSEWPLRLQYEMVFYQTRKTPKSYKEPYTYGFFINKFEAIKESDFVLHEKMSPKMLARYNEFFNEFFMRNKPE